MQHDRHRWEKALDRVTKKVESLPVPPSSRKAILAFSDHCFSSGLSVRRVIKYLYTLANIAQRLPQSFEDADRHTIEVLVQGIERSPYADWTKRDFRVTLKKFYRWLRGTEDYPPEVRWLRCTLHNQTRRLPEELLTQDEVCRMIAAAEGPRDKALIATLYESGCRIGELLALQVKHVQPHEHGIQITVRGGKGSRRVLLIASAPLLVDWLNNHPRHADPNAGLWATNDYRAEPLCYSRASAVIQSVARRIMSRP